MRRSPEVAKAYVLEAFVRGLAGRSSLFLGGDVPEHIRDAAAILIDTVDALCEHRKREDD